MDRIVTSTYNAARNGSLQIENFPDFSPLVEAMRSCNEETPATSDYKACVVHPSGALMLKESLMDQFQDMPGFEEFIKSHNEAYNPEEISANDRRSASEPEAPQIPASNKTILVESSVEMTPEKLAALPNVFGPQAFARQGICMILIVSLNLL